MFPPTALDSSLEAPPSVRFQVQLIPLPQFSPIFSYLDLIDMGATISRLKNKASPPSVEKMSTATETETESATTMAQAFQHYAQAQSSFKPPMIANGNAFLGDVFTRSDFSLPSLLFPPSGLILSPYLISGPLTTRSHPSTNTLSPFSTAKNSPPKLPFPAASTASKPALHSTTRTPTTR